MEEEVHNTFTIPANNCPLNIHINVTTKTAPCSSMQDATETLMVLQQALELFPKEDDKYRLKICSKIKYLIAYIDQEIPNQFPIKTTTATASLNKTKRRNIAKNNLDAEQGKKKKEHDDALFDSYFNQEKSLDLLQKLKDTKFTELE